MKSINDETKSKESKGGKSRAAALDSNKRSEIARKGAIKRWENAKDMNDNKPIAIHPYTEISPLNIGDIQLPCAVLENGTPVIAYTEVTKTLGRSMGGKQRKLAKSPKRGSPLPGFLYGAALEPFVSPSLRVALNNPIMVRSRGGLRKALNATLIPEICEVWNDEFGKWIYIDGDHVNHYNYHAETAEPLNLLDFHYMYHDYFYPDRKVDWLKDTMDGELRQKMTEARQDKPPVKRGSLTHHKPIWPELSGFVNAAYMRMVPRNNWYEKPYPRPLNLYGWSSWQGLIIWYDERTPYQRQYSWFTDRPRDMWPDLNKVHVDITQGFGNDRLFLRFETYTPNFSHFEVNVDDTGWKKIGKRWTWLLQSGRNNLRVRAANMLGAKGYPSKFVLNHADAPFAE